MQARLTKASIKTLPRVSPVSPLCPSEKTKTGKTPCLYDKEHFLRDKKHFLRDSDPFLCDSDVV